MSKKVYLFPGQGSQKKGMGKDLFDAYPEITARADEILGYSIKELCLEDPDKRLQHTQYTQPAIYVVNALTWMKKTDEGERPDYVAGHSLGEYDALLAAGVFDFETGLRLVKERGRLMAEASGGGMAAIVGLPEERVRAILAEQNAASIDVANLNTPSQIVIAGPKEDVEALQAPFKEAGVRMYSVLRVSAPFHSRYMSPAMESFGSFLEGFQFSPPQIPVIANITARPYDPNRIKENLRDQIGNSVKWTETVRYLMGKGVEEFVECGHGKVMQGLVKNIKKEAGPLIVEDEPVPMPQPPQPTIPAPTPAVVSAPSAPGQIIPARLGSAAFREDYRIRYAYASGAMHQGIASAELVIRMGEAGLMGFFGSGGLSLDVIENAIRTIQGKLGGKTYGMNLFANMEDPKLEEDTVSLYLRYGVRNVEASAYMQITPALVHFRLKGAHRNASGLAVAPNFVIAKVSRPEVAESFMAPAPERILNNLVERGMLTPQEAALAPEIPMSSDICVQADSAGHTDMGQAAVLMPAILKLRSDMMIKNRYAKPIRVGQAGGIGSPESAAAAFVLGADFVMTGSINQCSPESGQSDIVKHMLSEMNVQDTEYAPAGDLFELGAKIQVLKRGVFFPARANKLYELYKHHNAIEEIDPKTQDQIQKRYFKKSFEEVWNETRDYWQRIRPDEIAKAERNPKHKMALIFKWYFGMTIHLAQNGEEARKVDFQIHCGPALGSFNQWVKGSDLENWRRRHVDIIAERLMTATAALLTERFASFHT